MIDARMQASIRHRGGHIIGLAAHHAVYICAGVKLCALLLIDQILLELNFRRAAITVTNYHIQCKGRGITQTVGYFHSDRECPRIACGKRAGVDFDAVRQGTIDHIRGAQPVAHLKILAYVIDQRKAQGETGRDIVRVDHRAGAGGHMVIPVRHCVGDGYFSGRAGTGDLLHHNGVRQVAVFAVACGNTLQKSITAVFGADAQLLLRTLDDRKSAVLD